MINTQLAGRVGAAVEPGRMARVTSDEPAVEPTNQSAAPVTESRPGHPVAIPPLRLFGRDGSDADENTEDEAEHRWRRRFSAARLSLPDSARDAEDHAVFVSNTGGVYELYCWDVAGGEQQQATSRPDGTVSGTLGADGEDLYYFDDSDGDEFGAWLRQPFGVGPGGAVAAFPNVPEGYSAGLVLGRDVSLVGFSDDDGTRIHLSVGAEPARVVYTHANDAWPGGLSRDDSIWILGHAEHGDSRYPALRAYRVADHAVLGQLDDTPGKGLTPLGFSPVVGDPRVLVGHERRGRDELLIWDVLTGDVTELPIDLPGDLSADFYPDGTALLVVHTRAARSTLHRYDLFTGELTDLPAARGVIEGASVREDGTIWYRWSNAEKPAQLRRIDPSGTDEVLLTPPGEPAPDGVPVRDVWTEGPGGPIHALVADPAPTAGAIPPAVFYLHGGPTDADEDQYQADRAAWTDAGFTFVQVNYRGSTGYGSAWRDAISERIGHIELADAAAVQDHLIARRQIDPARCVVAGGSWGGFLTLLALGTQPDRWAVGVAAVPVADYLLAYEDEMEQLRAFDRSLFGGSPDEKPDAYRDSSPLTYVDQVRAPVLILAGENDPRCPIRQIENYLDALAARPGHPPYEVYQFEAGHGSMVVEERIRQVALEIDFARRHLPTAAAHSKPGSQNS